MSLPGFRIHEPILNRYFMQLLDGIKDLKQQGTSQNPMTLDILRIVSKIMPLLGVRARSS